MNLYYTHLEAFHSMWPEYRGGHISGVVLRTKLETTGFVTQSFGGQSTGIHTLN